MLNLSVVLKMEKKYQTSKIKIKCRARFCVNLCIQCEAEEFSRNAFKPIIHTTLPYLSKIRISLLCAPNTPVNTFSPTPTFASHNATSTCSQIQARGLRSRSKKFILKRLEQARLRPDLLCGTKDICDRETSGDF